MIAPLAKFIDWLVIQAASLRMAPLRVAETRLEEALDFLKGPVFAALTDSQAVQVEFTGRLHFRFPTPASCDLPENNTVYGKLYRCPGHWQEQPVIILLHGRDDFVGYRLRYPFIARRCNRVGINAAALVAPYHFQRRPCQYRKLSRPDYLRLAQAAAQAVAEIRVLTSWFLAQGCPSVALWGSSMGGWLTGLTVCRESRLAAGILTKPAVHSNDSMANLIVRRNIRTALRRLRPSEQLLDQTPLNLTKTRPAIPKDKILLIEGAHDLFTPPAPIEDLWHSWGEPEIWRLQQGHISLSLMPGLTRRVLQWLSPRLEVPALRTV